ncbi:DOMON domain-containing protein [Spirochaeta dissipatitropha]
MKGQVALIIAYLLIFTTSAWAGGAQEIEGPLPATGSGPVTIDGTIDESEYSHLHMTSSMAIYFSRIDDDNIAVAVTAPTQGWLAIGFESARMDGAYMLIAFSQNGEQFFEEHRGSGWSHSKMAEFRVNEYAVAHSPDDHSIFEAVVPAEIIEINGRGEEFPFIIAHSRQQNFTARHVYRSSERFRITD